MNARLLWAALDRWPEELIARRFRSKRHRGLRYCTVGWLHQVAIAQRAPCSCRVLPWRLLPLKATLRCVAAAYDLEYEEIHRLMRRNDHLEMWGGDRDRSARMRGAVRTLLARAAGDVQSQVDGLLAAAALRPVDEVEHAFAR